MDGVSVNEQAFVGALKSSHNPEWLLKGFSEAIWTISRTKLCHAENAAWSLGTVPNTGNDVRILGFFVDEFHKKNLHLEAETSVKIYIFGGDLL